MDTYDTLYRMRKMELQTYQQEKSKLEQVIESFIEKEKQLDQELADQDSLVSEDSSYRMTYGLFFERYRQRKANYQESQNLARNELLQLMDKMHAKFSEMKKMELLQEQQDERRLSEVSQHENKERDDATIIRVSRDGLGLNS